MKRKDFIFKKLIEMNSPDGISAGELAKRLGLDRANVSRDLNALWREGKVRKQPGRPVRFSVSEAPSAGSRAFSASSTILDRLAEACDSLRTACEQGKAAVLYPPGGMHMLLLGETGVGKTMFAECLHRYAVEVGKMAESAPFVTFNCADYASNPQLLLGQLFGVKRGAFTGAREQRGLLEIADGGVLFLDEVHRLPGEGQEMLFTFIDKGCFRRLGETEAERTARVLLIAATTENPGCNLLKTFTRRIPMVIELPPLRERSLEERYRLILGFFKEEAIRLRREIHVSPDVIRALLYYRCPNNVGQLKVDIQLMCAKAFADHVSTKKKQVQLDPLDVPPHVKEGWILSKPREDEVSLHEGWYVFHPAEREEMFVIAHREPEQTVYEKIEKRYNELKARGVDDDELDLLMEMDIENYFTYYLKRVSRRVREGGSVKIVRPEILKLAEEILEFAEEKLCRKFCAEVLQSLALHIQASADRIKKGGKIVNPRLNQVRRKYKAAFVTAIDCLKKIEDRLNIDLPIDEAGFLTMFFVLDPTESKDAGETVQILVLAHGNGIAAAMAEVANQLLGTRYASAVDIPLTMSPKEAFERVKEQIQKTASGVLLLADMGSLVRFDEMLEDELNIPVKAIPMVSTLHVLEATRKAMLGYTLEQLHEDLKQLTPFDAELMSSASRDESPSMKGAIVTACLTGKGNALAIKKALENYLTFNRRWLEIIPLQTEGPHDLVRQISRMRQRRNLLCIVSDCDVEGEIPQFRVEEVLNLKAVEEIQYLIDSEETYCKMAETLRNHLRHVDPVKVVSDVKRCLGEVQARLNVAIPKGDLIGVVLHTCCMVDRLVSGDDSVSFKNKRQYIRERFPIYQTVREVFGTLEETYRIELSDDEICYLISFLDGAKREHAQ